MLFHAPTLKRSCIFLYFLASFQAAMNETSVETGDYKHHRKSLYVTDKALLWYGSEGHLSQVDQ